ncbi:MAG: hypothetical protein KC589_06680 [Nanoarchaeota archaeon]|nr:hypothetical protein [Nanoarchaeota archaeon]
MSKINDIKDFLEELELDCLELEHKLDLSEYGKGQYDLIILLKKKFFE